MNQAVAYQLNPAAAKEGDGAVGSRITEKGDYTGVFTEAKAIGKPGGAIGIEFTFKDDGGATAKYLSLYTHNADGVEIYGLKQLNAIMYCMKVRGCSPQQGMVADWQNNQEVQIGGTIYPELMDKPIGVVLRNEEYYKKDGSGIASSMKIVAPFSAESSQTASEMVDNKPPANLQRVLESLQDKKVAPMHGGGHQSAQDEYADFNDELPTDFG